jgi:tRNA nucleotidyltransferase/poly(A) polymerase
VWPDIVLDLADALADLETPLYLVGGAVRDAFLRRPIRDVDIAADGSGIQIARAIANRLGGDFFPLDAERDVGRALLDTPDGRLVFDVARFRGDSLQADLVDRDFAVNAMAVDLRGDLRLLIDPLGGEADLIAKRLRACSPMSIRHDPIRALRAVRISLQFGLRIEPATIAEIRANSGRLAQISPERVRDEFVKLLGLAKPALALQIANSLGLLTIIVPEVARLEDWQLPEPFELDGWKHTAAVVEHLADILRTISPARTDETAAQFSLGMLVMGLDRFRAQLQTHIARLWPDERPHASVLLLAALLHDAGATADGADAGASAALTDARAAALHLSGGEREHLAQAIRHHRWLEAVGDPTPLHIHRFWRAASTAGIDAILLGLANYLGSVGSAIDQDYWLMLVERARTVLFAYFEQYEQIVAPPLLINGTDLMHGLGLKPGPMIGDLLTLIREAQVQGEVLTADEALERARAYLRSQNGSR